MSKPIQKRNPKPRQTCRWKLDEWHEYFDTGCGAALCFEEPGLPKGYLFCPYCGGRIQVKKPKP